MSKILVTGANGFVGQHLIKYLNVMGHEVIASSRSGQVDNHHGRVMTLATGLEKGLVDDLRDIDCIIHLAGRAHILSDTAPDPLAVFRVANRDLAVFLAKSALEAGVRRFIYLSSIGVNGIETFDGPFSDSSAASPKAAYAISKHEAEQGLMSLLGNTSTELVLIRPPLVYGPDAPGNFKKLLGLVSSGFPLPLGKIGNKRAMIYIHNLTDFIFRTITMPEAANKLFLVSDGRDISTSQIIAHLAQGMDISARLIYVPEFLMRLVLTAVGKRTIFCQLYGSLEIDSKAARDLIGWSPPFEVEEALISTGRDYLTALSTK